MSPLYVPSTFERNAIINGGFTINQRGYASGAVLAAGSYGHDRWKAGSGGGDYSFTQLQYNTTITIAANKTLIQVIENKNVAGGTYVLTWTGTAQARAGVDSATPSGSYAASPLLITGQTAGTVMSVEFNAGTLGNVQLEAGTTPSPFHYRAYSEELELCMRYCEAIGGTTGRYGVGRIVSTSIGEMYYPWKVKKRTTPTISLATPSDWAINDRSVQVSLSSLGTDASNPDCMFINGNCSASTLTVDRPSFFAATGTTPIIADAEL